MCGSRLLLAVHLRLSWLRLSTRGSSSHPWLGMRTTLETPSSCSNRGRSRCSWPLTITLACSRASAMSMEGMPTTVRLTAALPLPIESMPVNTKPECLSATSVHIIVVLSDYTMETIGHVSSFVMRPRIHTCLICIVHLHPNMVIISNTQNAIKVSEF